MTQSSQHALGTHKVCPINSIIYVGIINSAHHILNAK